MDQNVLSEIKSILDTAKSVLVVTHKEPTIDSVAASLALSEALASAGKITSVACPTPLTVEFTNLFGVDKVETKVGNKNLIISLDYAEGSIEKVSYNVEGDKFNLIIQPKPGFPAFSSDKVRYSQTGINADAIVVIGASDLSRLDNLFDGENEILEKVPLINIDNNLGNRNFGKVNYLDQSASSLSQLVMNVVQNLGISLDADTASNVLTGIEAATDSFKTGNITPETFETAALCLRYGAKRFYMSNNASVKPQPVQAPFMVPQKTAPQMPAEEVQSSRPLAVKGEPQDQNKTKKGTKPPPDWLQPKVYKGGQLL